MKTTFKAGLLACALTLSIPAFAADDPHAHHNHHESHDVGMAVSGDHSGHQHVSAPIGVMGDHMHAAGDWMLSYRYMHMNMDGNRKGTSDIDPVTIATTEANRFTGVAGQPPTLRVVPTEMTMQMHMLGAMFAPTDWLTLMAMANYLEKDMDHITFAGGAGTTILGTFSTQSNGWGDTKLSGFVRLYEDDMHHVHLNAGLSIPTGSIKETATVLAPNGMTPRLRMPYAMQLGTGTYDLLPGLTYTGHKGEWGWGAQYTAEIRLEDENNQNYAWGDKHTLSAWGSYKWTPGLSSSARLIATSQGDIDGIDPQILAPVQTADPDNYGGRALDISLGMTYEPELFGRRSDRFGIEVSTPLYQDLNGLQLERDYAVTLGWSHRF